MRRSLLSEIEQMYHPTWTPGSRDEELGSGCTPTWTTRAASTATARSPSRRGRSAYSIRSSTRSMEAGYAVRARPEGGLRLGVGPARRGSVVTAATPGGCRSPIPSRGTRAISPPSPSRPRRSHVPDLLRQLHRAELRPAHRAEVRELRAVRGQGGVVEARAVTGSSDRLN